ncbi:MAG: TonB-dependent receptor [Bacteroidota bacterium]
MKYLLTLLLGIGISWSYAQDAIIEGTVTDVEGTALIGANVLIKDTSTGTVTDFEGKYALKLQNGTYVLVVTYTGYAPAEKEVTVNGTATLDFELAFGTALDEVVVSGSRRPEKITESPATIATVYARQIEEYAGNPAELIARQKGIDYFRAGVAAPAFNIRGFNSNFNSKNLQVVDGRISTLVATGLPFGPLSTNIKEDVEQYEVILGPNATLYGPNAHNGLLNTITKDPRTSQGTNIAINPGVNGDGEGFFSGRVRHAQKLSDKFAFKITGEYTRANEFDYVDSVFIDRVGAFDETGKAIPDGQAEGYPELELDEDISFLRTEAALYFSPTNTSDIIFNWGRSNSTYLSPTNVGRNQIIDWRINYYQLRYTNKHFFAQAYLTQSITDDTYSIDDRTKQYYRLLDAGFSDADARGEASFASGALFKDNSRRWNAEAQYNNTFGSLSVVGGVQWQYDQANSLGTYLLDENEDDFINVNQIGAYAHLTYDFPGGWRVLAAARADNHEIYDFNFVPKFGILNIGAQGTWRLTYGQGIAAPTILNMFGDLFSGLILGNAEGFTLLDGSTIERQSVEKLQTFELGYRGQVVKNKLFVDANAYYNISRDFLSPVTVVGVTTARGDTPIAEVQSGFAAFNGLVATYINFGEVNTFGADFGITYYINPQFSVNLNYSYFDFSVDEENLENDFNNDGVVNFLDILVNAPTHKGGLGFNYSGKKFFANGYVRFVDQFNYFSSFQIASETLPGLTYRGKPIVENARSADTFNYGPLGGFATVDIGVGYRFSDLVTFSLGASNLFNQELREFTAVAPTKGLYTAELRLNLPAIGKKK